jgi:hypothetical protein
MEVCRRTLSAANAIQKIVESVMESVRFLHLIRNLNTISYEK